jgi:glycerophosphoryl diester phosphodiesterase
MMTSGPRITHRERSALLVCHMGALSGRHARNSIEAIGECFEANVDRIEIDIHSLAGDDYVVFHDYRYETATTHTGAIGKATPDDVRAMRFLDRPESRPALLSEVVEMARGCETELQLDWKDLRLVSPRRVRALVETVRPIRDRVIVSAPQDWNLRRLRAAAPDVPQGFDPGHYIDYVVEEQQVILPRNLGAYGYRDDHPMAFGRGDNVGEYLDARMEMLALQAPGAREFFLNYRLVLQMLDDGFDVAAWLHARGIGANAWTADYGGPGSEDAIERLIDAGIERITTNTAPAWVEAFASREERAHG